MRNLTSAKPLRTRTQGWLVLLIFSTGHSVDGDVYVFHARIVEAYGNKLLGCFAAREIADASL